MAATNMTRLRKNFAPKGQKRMKVNHCAIMQSFKNQLFNDTCWLYIHLCDVHDQTCNRGFELSYMMRIDCETSLVHWPAPQQEVTPTNRQGQIWVIHRLVLFPHRGVRQLQEVGKSGRVQVASPGLPCGLLGEKWVREHTLATPSGGRGCQGSWWPGMGRPEYE